MKTSSFHALASAAAFFVMCASLMAAGQKPGIIQTTCLKCHGGGSVNGDLDFRQRLTLEQRLDAVAKAASGEMPKNGPKLTAAQISLLKIELGINNADASSAPKGAPAASSLAKRPTSTPRSLNGTAPGASFSPAATAALKGAAAKSNPATPQGRVSVVSSTSSNLSTAADSSNVPTARVRVVVPGASNSKSTSVARVVVVTADDPTKTTVAPPKPVVKPQPIATTTDDSSKIPDAVKGLVGDWRAVARQGDGELSTVELQLDNHGWAKLTVPSTDGKPSTTTTHKVEYKDNKLELTSQNGAISLGKVVSSDGRQMVLEQETGLLTFVRP